MEHQVARSTSQSPEALAEKQKKRYEAIVKVLEIFVDFNSPFTSLRY